MEYESKTKWDKCRVDGVNIRILKVVGGWFVELGDSDFGSHVFVSDPEHKRKPLPEDAKEKKTVSYTDKWFGAGKKEDE